MSALGKPLRGFEKLALSLFGMTQPWSQSMDYSWKKHHPVPTNGRPDMRVLNRAKDNTVFWLPQVLSSDCCDQAEHAPYPSPDTRELLFGIALL